MEEPTEGTTNQFNEDFYLIDKSEEPSLIIIIANLRRPFTTPELREMLEEEFGKLTDLWVNKIKTHCFASFETIEDSRKAREKLHLTIWPQGGRKLVTKFV